MSDIQPGDVVICVDASPCRCCGVPLVVTRNATYRVEGTYPWKDKVYLLLEGLPASKPHKRGEWAERFRKIRPADEQFIREMRSIKPAPAFERCATAIPLGVA